MKTTNLINKIYEILKENKSLNKVNAFTYLNKTINFDESLAFDIQKLIMVDIVKNAFDEGTLTKIEFNNLLNMMNEALKEALTVLNKKSVIKDFLLAITEEDQTLIIKLFLHTINRILVENLTKQYTKDDSLGITVVSITANLGNCFINWWFDTKIKPKLRKKPYLGFDNFCEKHNLKFKDKLIYSWINNKYESFFKDSKQKENLKINENKLIIKIGSYFLNYLLKHKILTELPLTGNYRFLEVHETLEKSINLSSVYAMPLLSTKASKIDLLQEYNQDNTYKFQFAHENKFKYKISKELKKCINTNDTKYCIIRPFLDLYLDYQKEILEIPFSILLYDDFSLNSLKIQDYITTTYQVNIIELKKTCAQKDMKEILNFMQAPHIYNTTFSRAISKRIKAIRNKIKNYKKENTTVSDSFLTHILQEDLKFSLELNSLRNAMSKTMTLFNIVNKVASKKFFIKHFLEYAHIYKHFDYFYLPKTVTGVSRMSYTHYILNFQTSRFARAFLGYYSEQNTISKDNFETIKKIFKDTLYKTKNEIMSLTYDEYVNTTQKDHDDFLLHFFKPSITLELLKNYRKNSLSEMIHFFQTHFKKKDEILYALSVLRYVQYKDTNLYKNIEHIFVLDATNSVSQNYASIFNNKIAANLGCLTEEHSMDINQIFLKNINNLFFTDLPKIATDLSQKLNLKISDNIVDIFKQINFKFRLKNSLKIYGDLNKYLAVLLNSKKQLEINLKIDDKDFIKSFNAVMTSIIKTNILNPITKKEYLIYGILIIIINALIKKMLTKESWLKEALNYREIIKQRIMAEAYGMTLIGGHLSILNAFLDKALQQGINNYNYSYIDIFAKMLSGYFINYFKQKYIPHIQQFLDLRNFIKKLNKDSLTLTTKYLTWTCTPKRIKTLRVNVARLTKENLLCTNKRRFISVGYLTNKPDKNKIFSSICVYVIHTQESYLMTHWIINSQKLNKKISKLTGLNFDYTPNYDCFGTNFKYAVFLRPHIKNSYYSCNDDIVYNSLLHFFKGNTKDHQEACAYIKGLKLKRLDSNFWDGLIKNSLFVKH